MIKKEKDFKVLVNRDEVAEKIVIAKVIAEHTRRRELEKSGAVIIGEDGRVE